MAEWDILKNHFIMTQDSGGPEAQLYHDIYFGSIVIGTYLYDSYSIRGYSS